MALPQNAPVVHTDPEAFDRGRLVLDPIGLVDGNVARIGARFRPPGRPGHRIRMDGRAG